MKWKSKTKNGIIVFYRIMYDDAAQNPLDEMNGYGHIHPFLTRYIGYRPQTANTFFSNVCPECGEPLEASEYELYCMNCNYNSMTYKSAPISERNNNVPLTIYRHSYTRFSVAGEIRRADGYWEPDGELEEMASELTPEERKAKMEQWATEACKIYTAWANGQCYYVRAEAYHVTQCAPQTHACYRSAPQITEEYSGTYYDKQEAKKVAKELRDELLKVYGNG